MNGQRSVPWEREPVGRTIRALLLGIALLLVTPSVSLAADCQFVLGFKSLRDLIGHDIVGECLDNEHYNVIGDSNQHTTGGLLAWRKADNWTAFTDGYRTWVNGPNGLQQRLNTERFEWEADYAAISGQATASALTRDALRNAELRTDLFQSTFGFNDALVRLKDGIYEDVFHYKSNGSILEHPRWIRMWDEHPFAFGDLNADGIEDSVVITGVWEGGNIVFTYLTALRNEGGVPVHVASVLLGAKIGIDSMAISDGIVTLQTRQLGPDDANCCPSQEVELTYRLTGNAWLLLGEITQPSALPTPGPAPYLPVEQYVEGSRDLFGPEEWVDDYLRGRGIEGGLSGLALRDALRPHSYPLGSLYLAYLDSLGRYAPEDYRDFRSFYSEYFSDIAFRRDVASAVREYLESAEYLGPNLTAVLRSRQFSLDQSIHIIGSVGEAMLRATSPKWIADSVSVGRRQGIEGSLRGSFRDKTYAWLESNPIPNPWYEH